MNAKIDEVLLTLTCRINIGEGQAALGENLILLVNLGWSAVLYARFLAKRTSFAPLERWQTAYIPVYAVWAWVVVALFPIIFNYR